MDWNGRICSIGSSAWLQAATLAVLAGITLFVSQHYFDYNDFMYGAVSARQGRLYEEVPIG